MEHVFAKRLLYVYRLFNKSEVMNKSSSAEPAAKTSCTPKDLAAIAVHAWRIVKRSERDSGIPRPVGRNAEQILAILQGAGVEIISYLGRKADGGAKVEILEAIDGEENVVIEEHEPEVQAAGALVHRAVVSIGKGLPRSTEVALFANDASREDSPPNPPENSPPTENEDHQLRH
jgi:hypothetical protein